MRAYHRVDPLMDERKSHYTPAQFGAFLKVQLLAGRQTRRGWFRSVAALRGALPGPYAKHVDFLVAEGDLDIEADGQVHVDGWDEWQEGDLTVRDRMARLRNRHRNGTVTGTVMEPSPAAIRSSVGVGVSGEANASPPRAEWPDEKVEAAWYLIGRRRPPSSGQMGVIRWYLDTFDVTGPQRAERLILANPQDPIGALKADLEAFRAERLAALPPEPKPKPRRSSGLPESTKELLAHWSQQEREASA